MNCQFQVGQKVVCINDDRAPPEGHKVLTPMRLPEVGKVYTVRELIVGKIGGTPCILLEEIPDQNVEVLAHGVLRIGNIVFTAEAFRPVVERKTDISIFTALLNSQPEKVTA